MELLDLPDACLAAVAAELGDVADLVRLQLACKRLYVVCAQDAAGWGAHADRWLRRHSALVPGRDVDVGAMFGLRTHRARVQAMRTLGGWPEGLWWRHGEARGWERGCPEVVLVDCPPKGEPYFQEDPHPFNFFSIHDLRPFEGDHGSVETSPNFYVGHGFIYATILGPRLVEGFLGTEQPRVVHSQAQVHVTGAFPADMLHFAPAAFGVHHPVRYARAVVAPPQPLAQLAAELAPLDPDLVAALWPLQGLYGACYGPHGDELLQLTVGRDAAGAPRLEALKIKGDPNVPAGRVSFVAGLDAGVKPGPYDPADDDPFPFENVFDAGPAAGGAPPAPAPRPVLAFFRDGALELDLAARPVRAQLTAARGQINHVPLAWNPEWVEATVVVYDARGRWGAPPPGPRAGARARPALTVIFEDRGAPARHAIDLFRLAPDGSLADADAAP